MRSPFKKLFFVCLIAGMGMLLFAKLSPKHEPERELHVFPMTDKEATSYVQYRLQPMLDRIIRDTSYPASLRQRIESLFSDIQNGNIGYQAWSRPNPYQTLVLAHTDYDTTNKRPVLMIFTPIIRATDDWYKRNGLPEEEFELEVAIMYAHEYIHVQNQAKYGPLSARVHNYSPEKDAEEEAAAWAFTIFEIVRPAMARREPLPEYWRERSRLLGKLNNNFEDTVWIALFRGNYSNGSR